MANLKRTREDILESVIDTVHRNGLMSTGLSKLFHLSGASSGSFYNYFSSKQELGHALIDFEWEKLQANVLAPAAERYESPIDQLFLDSRCAGAKTAHRSLLWRLSFR